MCVSSATFFARTSYKNHICIIFLVHFLFLLPTLATSDKRTLIHVSRVEKSASKRLTDGGKSRGTGPSDDFSVQYFGKLVDIGKEQESEGRVQLLDSDCGDEDEKDFARLPNNWVAVMHFKDKLGSSSTSTDPARDCPSVVDRMRKALVFGASAIIILTLNPGIIKELEIAQMFSKPVILVDKAENITHFLHLISSKVKVKAKLLFNVTLGSAESQNLFTTVTLWGTCGRYSGRSYHEWDGVVCLGHHDTNKDGKVDQENFWNYFYTAILILMMMHYLRTRRGQNWEDQDYLEGHIRELAYKALGLMKTKRYSADGSQDTCAICLEIFFQKQKLRVLPCGHHFHTKCVDPWLVRNHTCPLCKLNVIEKLEHSFEED